MSCHVAYKDVKVFRYSCVICFQFLFVSLLQHSWRQHTYPPLPTTPETNHLNTQLPVQFLHICRKTFLTRLTLNLEECWWEKQVTGLCEECAAVRGTPAQESTPFQHLHPFITTLWPAGHSHHQHSPLHLLLQSLVRAQGHFASSLQALLCCAHLRWYSFRHPLCTDFLS